MDCKNLAHVWAYYFVDRIIFTKGSFMGFKIRFLRRYGKH